jgi:hypothetical protein
MSLFCNRFVLNLCAAFLVVLVSVAGANENNADSKTGSDGKVEEADELNAELTSAHDLLSDREFEKFQPGQPKDELLKKFQWRGNLVEAATHDGKAISLITYRLFTDAPDGVSGESVLAVFVNGKFEKFVSWPDGPTPQFAVGEFPLVVHALKSKPISLSDLKKLSNARGSQPDPGLTVTWLLFGRAVIAANERRIKSMKEEYLRNAKLRDQYNASRLEIGMNEQEVENVLQAKPIESGAVKGGMFKIYGSTESVGEIGPHLHYSNVLILFEDGKVKGIYSDGLVPGGKQGLQTMRMWFSNLPPK